MLTKINNVRWLTSLFNFIRDNRWMFGNRRKNRGRMLSLLGLGVRAVAVYGMTRGRRNKIKQTTVQPILNRFNNR